jgi:hypothetical protein
MKYRFPGGREKGGEREGEGEDRGNERELVAEVKWISKAYPQISKQIIHKIDVCDYQISAICEFGAHLREGKNESKK